jgi:hypothetical protein
MAVFTLSNGQKFEKEGATGKYLEVLADREYIDQPDREKSFVMPEEFENSDDKRVKRIVNLRDRNTFESMQAEDTYLLAVNRDYKEFERVPQYDGTPGSNAVGIYTIEVMLRFDELEKRLLLEKKGRNTTFMHFAESIMDYLVEDIEDGALEEQGAYIGEERSEPFKFLINTATGDYLDTIVSERELKDAIVSVSLVKYDLEIDGEDKKNEVSE